MDWFPLPITFNPVISKGLDNRKIQRKIVNIYLPINFNVLGAQKNRLIETVLLSSHNICFG